MNRLIALVLLSALAACSVPGSPRARKNYPYRWVYVSRSLSEDSHVEDIREIADTCAAHGLNGILLAAGLDRLDLADIGYINRLFDVRQIGRDTGVEIIPVIFSVGYGGSVLAHNKNLAAGTPVIDALYIAGRNRAGLAADPPVELSNGGFEQSEANAAKNFGPDEVFGSTVFRDTEKKHSGASSLRFQNMDSTGASVSTEIEVSPHRLYRLSMWIMAEDTGEDNPFGSSRINLQATAPDGRPLEWIRLSTPGGEGWQQVVEGFNSREYDRVKISIEARRGTKGKFWVDDLSIEEAGMVNLLRRPGTPLVVRNEATDELYEEGRDFAPVADSILDFRFDHRGPDIELLPGGRIKPGSRLRVSFYHGTYTYRSQVTLCMSEPEVYDIWRENALRIQSILHCRKYFLDMDEIRNGGSCETCRARGMTMGQMVGDCITRQTNILRWANPDAEIFIWSDMIDPNHNARDERPYYYYVDGNYGGSWNYIPKDLHVACWWYEKRRSSLDFFSSKSYRTLGAAYYDADNLENPKGWLEALDSTPDAEGIIYTTWLNKYNLLDDFGDLVSRNE
ncbi:MAG: hypothetical protein FVQ81_12100 [Candidatus Glassbacteria bacterium]|nr:hypothetical protein [Candidatus Glassbacteria bacterium]